MINDRFFSNNICEIKISKIIILTTLKCFQIFNSGLKL